MLKSIARLLGYFLTNSRPSFSTTRKATNIKTSRAEPKNSRHFRSSDIDEIRFRNSLNILVPGQTLQIGQ